MKNIDWARLRAEAEAETIAQKSHEILADPNGYECDACCIEGQPCDVGLAVEVERARITRLLELRLAEYQNLDIQVGVATLADAIKFIQPSKTDLLE